jgi:hypothetical protein
VEKDQVTIALTASGLTGPLGQHVASAFIALEGVTQELVIVQHNLGVDREFYRHYVKLGSWPAHDADVCTAQLGDALWTYLLRYKGVQPLLPVPLP